MSDDSAYLAKHTPGLGPKGAKRIVLELKDKFKDVDPSGMTSEEIFTPDTDSDSEAVSALMVLGYSREEAQRALNGAQGSVEDMVKHALKQLI